MTVGVAIITLNAESVIKRTLRPIVDSSEVTRCIIVDSSSTDSTVDLAKELGVEVHIIARNEFNHGATRELARKLLDTDIVVMVTQDAVALSSTEIGRLIRPLKTGDAEVSYARQLPYPGSDIFESFPRSYNYTEQSNIRSLSDAAVYGVYTFFCSDSFAAYSKVALNRVGGFPNVLTNEDYFVVAAILQSGGRIAYVADALVYHSHRYTLSQEFSRYFDTGYSRAERPWVQRLVGHAERRGAAMTKAMLSAVMKKCPEKLIYALIQVGVKWLGYRVGYCSLRAPIWWKRALSGQRYYWDSRFQVLENAKEK